MKTENSELKQKHALQELAKRSSADPETINLVEEDGIRELEVALEAEMPHLKIFETFEMCFITALADRDREGVKLPTATLFTDSNGRICNSTIRACQVLGYPPEELMDSLVTYFWRDRDRHRLGADYLKHLSEYSSCGRVHYVNLKTADGAFIPVRLRTARLPEDGLSTLGKIAVTIESISAKEIVNRAIDREIESLNEFSSTFPFPVFLKDSEHRFCLANQEFCFEIGCGRQVQVVGKCDTDFFPDKQAKKYIADDNYVLTHGQILETVEWHTPPNSHQIAVHVFKLPFFREGRVWGIICMYWPVERSDYAIGLLNFKG